LFVRVVEFYLTRIWNGRRRFFAWGASPPLSDLSPAIENYPGKTKNQMTLKFAHIIFTLVFLALLPRVHAQACAPRCDQNGRSTSIGQPALFHLTTGLENTAAGFAALDVNTTGSLNTAVGA
jgi:hypothetical protein